MSDSSTEPIDRSTLSPAVEGAVRLGYHTSREEPAGVTSLNLAFIACRILALWIVVEIIQALDVILVPLIEAVLSGTGLNLPNRRGLLSLLPFYAVLCGLGAFFWWKAAWLARRIVADPTTRSPIQTAPGPTGIASPGPTDADKGFDVSVISRIVLIAIGALTLSTAIPELGREILRPLLNRKVDLSVYLSSPEWMGQLVATLLKNAIGVGLILGQQGIRQSISRLRRRDLHVPGAEPRTHDDGADGPL